MQQKFSALEYEIENFEARNVIAFTVTQCDCWQGHVVWLLAQSRSVIAGTVT